MMNRFRSCTATAALLFVASTSSATGQSAQKAQSPHGDAQHGKQLFAQKGCYECHGREAQGGGLNGPRIAPDPIPFSIFQIFVRHPTSEMPPFSSKVLAEKDLVDIYAFLGSQPQPTPVSSIPILKP